ncbi:MAG: TRAP transporter substrate-binding protein DctP [Deltaproteobacteria bacterium]|nr:TRAP transporter substrate-binding protein DctP [Deltaproteobacteria bacterium]
MRKLLHLFILDLLLISTAPAWGAEALIIKFATVAPEGSAWMNSMKQLDKSIREKSKGQLGFRIYPGGVAGDELDVLRKIRIGQIHGAAFSGVGFGQILSMVRVLDLPFLFRNEVEVDLVHREMESFFSRHFREKGFELVAWAEVGNVHIFSRVPIRKVNDLERLRVWTWSGDPIARETFSAMGTNPIPLAVTDVTTALNTGMIDTVYAPPLGAIALQWDLYVKTMTSLPLAHSTGAFLLARGLAEQIRPDLLSLLKDESRRVMAELTTQLRKQTIEAIDLLKKKGIQILALPDGEDLKAFYDVHEEVAQALQGKVYPKEVLNRVYAILRTASRQHGTSPTNR